MSSRSVFPVLLVLTMAFGSPVLAEDKAVPDELLKGVKDSEPEARVKAIMGLSQLGVEAVPVLLEATKDQDGQVAAAAAYALKIIKLEPMAYLKALQPFLGDKDKSVREAVTVALGQCGVEALDPLMTLAKDEIVEVRQKAILSLQAIVQKDPMSSEKVFPLLEKALKDTAPPVRVAAIQGLSRLGAEAIPVLLAATKDEEANVAAAAEYALRLMKLEEPVYLKALQPFISDKRKSVREAVAVGLGRCGLEGIETLTILLKDEDFEVRRKAVQALQVVAQKNPKATENVLPGLERALKDEAAPVRLAAVQALPKIGPAAVPVILAALGDSDAKVRAFAAAALTHFKLESDVALAPLEKRFKVEEANIVRQSLLQTLTKFGPAAIPVLVEALKDPALEVQKVALTSLGKIGVQAKVALHGVKEMAAKSSHPDLRKTAVGVLSKFGPDGKSAIIELLKVDDQATREACLIYLAKQKGPAPASAVIDLVAALGDNSREIRGLAIRVLGNTGPDAKEALPVLTKFLTDADEQIQKEAELAVKKIGGN